MNPSVRVGERSGVGAPSVKGCTGHGRRQVWHRWDWELGFQTCSLLRCLLDIPVEISNKNWTDTPAENPEKRVMWETPVFPQDLKPGD